MFFLDPVTFNDPVAVTGFRGMRYLRRLLTMAPHNLLPANARNSRIYISDLYIYGILGTLGLRGTVELGLSISRRSRNVTRQLRPDAVEPTGLLAHAHAQHLPLVQLCVNILLGHGGRAVESGGR